MSNLTDHQLMTVAEVTWGTPVAVSRAVPFLPSDHDWDPTPYEGQGLYSGAPGGIPRADRSGAGIGFGTLSEKYEAQSKGLGLALQAAFGTATHTLVSGSTYQQVFTPTVTGTTLPSRTVQYAVVDNAGTLRAHTYAGVSVDELDLDIPEGPDSIATWQLKSDAKSLSTATAAGTPTMTNGSLFGSWSVSGVVNVGGTITAPTTTALASSSGSVSGETRSVGLSMKNKIDKGRWGVGTRNQPTVGQREITLKIKAEFNSTTLRDALIAQSNLALLVDLQTGEALSAGNARLQLAVPVLRLRTGAIPPVTDNGQTVIADIQGKVLWDGTNQPIYVVQRTADTAL